MIYELEDPINVLFAHESIGTPKYELLVPDLTEEKVAMIETITSRSNVSYAVVNMGLGKDQIFYYADQADLALQIEAALSQNDNGEENQFRGKVHATGEIGFSHDYFHPSSDAPFKYVLTRFSIAAGLESLEYYAPTIIEKIGGGLALPEADEETGRRNIQFSYIGDLSI